MKPTKPTLLLHPVFLLSLVLLLLNDGYWKEAYGNFVTGKLSDFTGLIVFAGTFISLFPTQRKWVIGITALGFTWWKSEGSQPFIDWLEADLHLQLTRVVDLTDLWALLVLPIVYHLRPLALPWHMLRPALLVLAFTAMVADTPPRYISEDGSYNAHKSFSTRQTKAQTLQRLRQAHPGVIEDTGTIYELPRKDLLLKRTDSLGGVQWIRLTEDSSLQVYRRMYFFQSLYIIPGIVIEGDTLYRVRVGLDDKADRNKTKVNLLSFYLREREMRDYHDQHRTVRRYAKPLKRYLKDLLEH